MKTAQVVVARARLYDNRIAEHQFLVKPDAVLYMTGESVRLTIRVWDDVAGHFTACYELCDSAKRRIRKLAEEQDASECLSPDPAHDVTGNGHYSHYDLANQLEMRGYTIRIDTDDTEHSYVEFEGRHVGDIYGDEVSALERARPH